MTRILPLALCLALALPARAEDACHRSGDTVVCAGTGFDTIMQAQAQTEHDRAVAVADAVQARSEVQACRTDLAAVRALPAPEPAPRWGWVATAGGVGVVLGVVATVLVVRAVR